MSRLWGLWCLWCLRLLTVLPVAGAAHARVYEYDGPNPPRFVAPAPAQRVQLALVLGSGGRRGFAHAGVLRTLEAAKLKPDLIIGVSIGSVIGSLYASGMSAAEVEKLAMNLDLSEVSDLSWLYWGRVRGQKLQDFINTRVRQRPLEAMGIRFAAVATREHDSALQVFNSGNAGVAVRASSAVPGRFFAVCINGVNYIDGDVASPVPVPVRAARAMGAQVVIAVDISAQPDTAPAGTPDDWLRRDRERRVQIDAEVVEADVLIRPDIGYFAGTSSSYRARSIALAADATRAALPRINAALAAKRLPASAVVPASPPAMAGTPPTAPTPPAAR